MVSKISENISIKILSGGNINTVIWEDNGVRGDTMELYKKAIKELLRNSEGSSEDMFDEALIFSYPLSNYSTSEDEEFILRKVRRHLMNSYERMVFESKKK